jgi:hypothetical protein
MIKVALWGYRQSRGQWFSVESCIRNKDTQLSERKTRMTDHPVVELGIIRKSSWNCSYNYKRVRLGCKKSIVLIERINFDCFIEDTYNFIARLLLECLLS